MYSVGQELINIRLNENNMTEVIFFIDEATLLVQVGFYFACYIPKFRIVFLSDVI